MWFFYFLPMLVAIGFLLARATQGGSVHPRPSRREVALAVLGIVVLGVLGAVFAGLLR
jgi:hypothetical protein